MSETPESPATRPLSPAPQPRRRGGFLSRLLAAFLVVIIATFLALAGVAAALFALGATPDIPGQLADARARLGTSEALNLALQTQVSEASRRSDAANETLGELQRQVSELNQLGAAFATGSVQNATQVAEARASRDSVTLFATAEAGRAALLSDLQHRSDRIERFLQRLSDISSDAALDLGGVTPTVIVEPPLAPTPTAAPTSAPTAPPTETPTPTATPTAARPTAAARPSSTPRTSPTP